MTEIENAIKVLTDAMQDTSPGSYAHAWHCNIAMACYDAILRHDDQVGFAYKVGNDAASRFMKQIFGVDTTIQREHYQVDEWIPTNGKKPDLPNNVEVDVMFRCGDTPTGLVDVWYWNWIDKPDDITHYRIHKT